MVGLCNLGSMVNCLIIIRLLFLDTKLVHTKTKSSIGIDLLLTMADRMSLVGCYLGYFNKSISNFVRITLCLSLYVFAC